SPSLACPPSPCRVVSRPAACPSACRSSAAVARRQQCFGPPPPSRRQRRGVTECQPCRPDREVGKCAPHSGVSTLKPPYSPTTGQNEELEQCQRVCRDGSTEVVMTGCSAGSRPVSQPTSTSTRCSYDCSGSRPLSSPAACSLSRTSCSGSSSPRRITPDPHRESFAKK